MPFDPSLIQTDPKTGYEILNPGKLYPPPHYIMRKTEKKKKFMPKNRILRFFWVFFGEGF